jgi:hypothetical protein
MDDEGPCQDCCDYIDGLMHAIWVELNASMTIGHANMIRALAELTEPEQGAEADIKIKMLRSAEGLAVSIISRVAAESEDAHVVDAFHEHLIRDLQKLRKAIREDEDSHAKRQRKAASRNGGGSAWTQ